MFFHVQASFIAFFFFFSSRRRHTRFDCDWSSDVCSSDLEHMALTRARPIAGDPSLIGHVEMSLRRILTAQRDPAKLRTDVLDMRERMARSEERRVGKECRSRWSPDQ